MLRQKPHFSTGIKEKRLLFHGIEKASVLSERVDSREAIVKGWIDKKVVEGVKLEEVFSQDNPLLDKLVIPDHLGKAVVYAHRPGEIEFAHQAFDKLEQQQIKAKERRLNLAVAEATTPEQIEAAQERLDTFLDELRDKYGDTNVGDNPGIGLPEARMVKSGVGQGKYSIDGLAYAALMWPEVKNRLSVAMAGVDERGLHAALQNIDSHPDLRKLVLELASSIKGRGSNIGNTFEGLTEAAKTELVAKVSAKPNVTVRKRTRRELVDLREKNLEKYEIGHSSDKAFDLVPPQELANENANLWRLSIDRSENRVNANNWSIADKNGLARLHFDLKVGLNLNTEAQPWKGVLNQLAKASDETYLKGLAGKADREWFKNPDKFEKELKTVDGGEDFLRAYKYYKALKLNMVEADKREALLTQKDKEKDRIAGVDTVIDGVKKNVAEFTRAVRNKDWATAGVYMAGIYAAYKLFKDSGDSSVGKFMKKALLWGGVGLLGAKVYEASTGQDILKKIGLKDALSDVEKTDLANLFRIPELEGLNKVDTDILHEASKVPMKKLWEQYNKSHNTSNTEGGGNISGFIDPLAVGNSAFEEKFGGLAGGLIDRREDSEYERSGRQLYLIMGLVHQAYTKTAYVDQKSEYYGVDFDKVMKGKEGLGTIDKFLAEMVKYAEVEVNEEGEEEANKRFGEVFAAKKLKPLLRPDEIAGKKVLAGSIMGYPVVVINNGREYAIYDYDEFKKNGAKANKMFTIAREGEVSSSDVDGFAGELEARAKAAVKKDMPAGASDLTWNGDHWEYKKAGDAVLNSFGIKPEEVTVKVVMHGGRVEHVESAGKSSDLVLKKFIEDSDSLAISALYETGKLEVKHNSVKESQAILLVGKLEVEIIANGNRKIEIKDASNVLQNEEFLGEYFESLMDEKTSTLGKSMDELEKSVKGMDREYLAHWTKKVLGMVSGTVERQGINASVIDDSVPDEQFKRLVEIVKAHTIERVRGDIIQSKPKTLGELDKLAEARMAHTETNVQSVMSYIANSAGNSQSREEFVINVIEPLRGAAAYSSEYKGQLAKAYETFYGKFANGIKLHAFDKESHKRVADMMKVFTYYTSRLDSKDLDSKKSVDREKKLRYMEYVKDRIIMTYGSNPSGLEDPDSLDITEYDNWNAETPDKKIFKLSQRPIQRNEFDENFQARLKTHLGTLKNVYGKDKFRTKAVFALLDSLERDLENLKNSQYDESGKPKFTRTEQIRQIDDFIRRKVVGEIIENKDNKYHIPDGAIEAAKNIAKATGKKAYEVSVLVMEAGAEFLEMEPPTKLELPPGTDSKMSKWMQSFKTLRKNDADQYVFDHFNGKEGVRIEELKPFFANLVEGWEKTVDNRKKALERLVSTLPPVVDENQKERVDLLVAGLKKARQQARNSRYLLEQLGDPDFEDILAYKDEHFKN